MGFLYELMRNPVFVAAISGWSIAQVLKAAIHLIIHRQFVAERLIGGGGMPSSHSATVCGLATAVGFRYGISGFEFTISIIFAIIVMYDAMGVRRETGNQAKVINEMMDMFVKMGNSMTATDKLKEFVGHTPLQVLIGAILGIATGILTCNMI